MNKTTKVLLKVNLISYFLFSIVLILGGIYAMTIEPDLNSTAKNINSMYTYGGIFILLIGTGILIAAYIKMKDVLQEKN